MGCSHTIRNPKNERTGKDRIMAEIKKYKNFNYAEYNEKE